MLDARHIRSRLRSWLARPELAKGESLTATEWPPHYPGPTTHHTMIGAEVTEPEQKQAATPKLPALGHSIGASTGDVLQIPSFLNRKIDDDDITTGVPSGSYEDAVRAAEKSLHRTQDAGLYRALAEQDFSGRGYRKFEGELARYGLSVMRGWLYTGHIFQVAASRNIKVVHSEALLHDLSASTDLRNELANSTVAVALTHFRQRATANTGWRPDGGASLTTYFMGACVLAFPNELRRHRLADEKWRRQTYAGVRSAAVDVIAEDRGIDTGHTFGRNPGTIATSRIDAAHILEALKLREQRIVLATEAGFTQSEIAELFGESSDRAVEGVLYRLRHDPPAFTRPEEDQP